MCVEGLGLGFAACTSVKEPCKQSRELCPVAHIAFFGVAQVVGGETRAASSPLGLRAGVGL